MAFTAAKCSVYCCTGRTLEWFHTSNCRQQVAITRGQKILTFFIKKRDPNKNVAQTKALGEILCIPCYHFHLRLEAGGLCST